MNLSLFVLICSPPPRSTLFPYTTLFRSAGGRGPGRSAPRARASLGRRCLRLDAQDLLERGAAHLELLVRRDRKSTRLNSSHPSISYAVFCLKKKKSAARTIFSPNTLPIE